MKKKKKKKLPQIHPKNTPFGKLKVDFINRIDDSLFGKISTFCKYVANSNSPKSFCSSLNPK